MNPTAVLAAIDAGMEAARAGERPPSEARFGLRGMECMVVPARDLPSFQERGVGSDGVGSGFEVVGEMRVCGETFLVVARDPAEAQDGNSRHGSIASLLTARELQIAMHVAQGLSNKEIARHIGISVYTIDEYLRRAYTKLGVRTRAAMVARVLRMCADTGTLVGGLGAGV